MILEIAIREQRESASSSPRLGFWVQDTRPVNVNSSGWYTVEATFRELLERVTPAISAGKSVVIKVEGFLGFSGDIDSGPSTTPKSFIRRVYNHWITQAIQAEAASANPPQRITLPF